MTSRLSLSLCINHRLTSQHPSCGGRGARQLAVRLERYLQQHGVTLPLQRVGCLGRCERGPTLRIGPTGHFFSLRGEEDFPQLLALLYTLQAD